MSNSTNGEILLAGAAAAFTVDLLVYPLDTIKTRIQSQDYIHAFASSAKDKRAPAHALRGLYQGVGSVIIATLPAAGIFFTVYEASKTLLANALPSSIPQSLIHSLASGAAELSSCVVLTPAEVIKQNAQMIRGRGAGTGSSGSTSLQALRMLRDAPGGAGRRLWAGYTALAARNLPFTALQFPMFEAFRARIWEWRRRGGGARNAVEARKGGVDAGQGILETGAVTMASAALSGSIAAVITTPTDVVKTRMMLLAGDGGKGQEKVVPREGSPATAREVDKDRRSGKKMSGLQVAKQVYAERGIRGLFRGGVLRAGWTAVGSGLYLGTYEMAKVWLKDRKEIDEDGGI